MRTIAAVSAALSANGLFTGSISDLYPKLGTTPRDGTHPLRIVRTLRRAGLKAELREGMTIKDLRDLVNPGKPGQRKQTKQDMIEMQAWRSDGVMPEIWQRDGRYLVTVAKDDGRKKITGTYRSSSAARDAVTDLMVQEYSGRWDDGHFVNVIRVGRKYIYFQDPSAGYAEYSRCPVREFEARWRDFDYDLHSTDGQRQRHDYVQMGIVITAKQRRTGPQIIYME